MTQIHRRSPWTSLFFPCLWVIFYYVGDRFPLPCIPCECESWSHLPQVVPSSQTQLPFPLVEQKHSSTSLLGLQWHQGESLMILGTVRSPSEVGHLHLISSLLHSMPPHLSNLSTFPIPSLFLQSSAVGNVRLGEQLGSGNKGYTKWVVMVCDVKM